MLVKNLVFCQTDILLELVSKELNHLAAILHVYAGGLIFMKLKKYIYFYLIIFIKVS